MAAIEKPKTVAIALVEGGAWIPWAKRVVGSRVISFVHAIKFEDGSIWDTVNGWRPSSE